MNQVARCHTCGAVLSVDGTCSQCALKQMAGEVAVSSVIGGDTQGWEDVDDGWDFDADITTVDPAPTAEGSDINSPIGAGSNVPPLRPTATGPKEVVAAMSQNQLATMELRPGDSAPRPYVLPTAREEDCATLPPAPSPFTGAPNINYQSVAPSVAPAAPSVTPAAPVTKKPEVDRNSAETKESVKPKQPQVVLPAKQVQVTPTPLPPPEVSQLASFSDSTLNIHRGGWSAGLIILWVVAIASLVAAVLVLIFLR